LVVAGVPGRYFAIGAAVAIVLAAVGWNLVMLDYQKDRVRTFISPGSDPQGAGYQLRQSKIAVGSGQLYGRGYQQGTQSQLRFLPARHTDFIFAVLAEEWGFIGVAVVLILYALYILNGTKVALRARDRVGILLIVGLLSGFAFHVLYNTAMVVGKEAGGARSWLGVGAYRLQPSEFAKIATALLLARYLAGINRRFLSFGQIMAASSMVALPMVLVALESDLGGAAMFVPMLAGMLVVAGVPWRYFAVGAGVALVLAAVGWNLVMLDYQKDRVRSFMSPGSDPQGTGYQLRQSKIAVGSGQLTGRGYQQGTQSQLRFLPARHTDFIFAVLAEEWGFIGVAMVLILYGLYIGNGTKVALRARDRSGILLIVGLLSGFAFHVLYNTAMVVGLLPITGIPLPFLSYGGSFTLANFIATGLILGVDFRRHVNR
jgi:rod shape determining protein RodA